MDLPRRQQRQLLALDSELRADPRLAGLLRIFSRLTTADPMPSHEQLPARVPRAGPLRAAAQAIARLTRAADRWAAPDESSLAACLAAGVWLGRVRTGRPLPQQDAGISGKPGPRRRRSDHPAG